MCGIFGVLAGPRADFGRKRLRPTLDRLFRLSESRGKEASGLAIRSDAGVRVLKQAIPASALIRSREYRAIFNGGPADDASPADAKVSFSGPFAAIGHSRLVTNGAQDRNENNQPVTYANVTGIHNGIVVNVAEIWERFPTLQPKAEVDTEAIMALVHHFRANGARLADAVREMFHVMEGAASVAILLHDSDQVALATNTGSLYLCRGEGSDFCIFGSEAYILRRLKEFGPVRKLIGNFTVTQVEPGTGYVVDLTTLKMERFAFEMNTGRKMGKPGRSIPKARELKVEGPIEESPPGLRRCSRCILPETMPFIEFDEDGVCNYCHNYRKMVVKTPDELEAVLSPYRSRSGGPDCIATFSGGRDSSYGLHLLKTELGMNPVAFSYDWGMVTDLARRNQARVCGKLGVEHILVSADIERKRANIRRNVEAWLRRPELGMVPLFMAGDKQFFYYANKVRQQTGVKLVVFSVNPLEKTAFKSGFCKVSQGKSLFLDRPSLRSMFSLAAYYTKNYLANPSYLNSSLVDSVWAYVCCYFLPHDYFMLYDYVRWDEDTINQTLITEYDWEIAKDTKTTWRIGDGTAPFYNYIYYKVAGFSENDTFRSNQVREGVLTREQALQLAMEDNRPRWESIREYLDLIGLDFEETMCAIDAIPTLYGP